MSAPDDYTLAKNLQTVLQNTLKAPHWNTATDQPVMFTAADLESAVRRALEWAAKRCDRIAGNTADFPRDHRRAAGQCAAEIRAADPATVAKLARG